jgi:serine phosphatase RsbU (regulator of sigma subunit)
LSPTFDLFETFNLVLWLLPLPFLGLALSNRGRLWWVGWSQVGALSLLCLLEVAAQIGPVGGTFAWIASRETIWNCTGGMILMVALSEGGLAGSRHGASQGYRKARRLAAASLPLFVVVAALAAQSSLAIPSRLGWIAVYASFETFAVLTTPLLWVRSLRSLAALLLGAAVIAPLFWLPFSVIAALLTATQALSRIRRENSLRIQRAREALQPQALQELLAGTTGSHATKNEEFPLEKLEALLGFAIQSSGSNGGAIFLYRETLLPESDTLSYRLGCAVSRGVFRELAKDPSAPLTAQILLSKFPGTETAPAREFRDTDRIEAFALQALHVQRLAAAPIRSRGKTMGLVLLSLPVDREKFSEIDLHLLDFLAQQAVFSLHYEAVYHRLQEDSRLSREFEIASKIQRSLLPRAMPSLNGLHVGARVLPAREVGGDYYDLLPLPDDKLLAVIGDVSGKGLGAGMIMLIVRTTLHLLVDHDSSASPSRLIRSLEERLVPQLDPFTFMTFLALRWSSRDRLLTWSGAGHEHILWHSTLDRRIHRIRTGGLALGLQRERFLPREEKRLLLNPGDSVLLYTDGVTDCRGPDGQAYGLDRLERTFERFQDLPSEEMVEAILSDLDQFRKQTPPTDDRTLVVFKAS